MICCFIRFADFISKTFFLLHLIVWLFYCTSTRYLTCAKKRLISDLIFNVQFLTSNSQFGILFHWHKMKLIFVLAVVCLLASSTDAQVRCLNPGSLEIPPSPCCGQMPNQGLAGALGAFFNLMDLECKINMFFDAILTDPDMLAFFNYITGPEFRVLIRKV